MREDQSSPILRLIDFLNDGLEERQALARELFEVSPAQWDGWLGEHPYALSSATFDALLDLAEAKVATDVSAALAITNFVTRHVDTLTAPAEAELALVFLRWKALTAHARALRASLRIDEALDVYESAAAMLRVKAVMAPELAEVEEELAAFRATLEGGSPREKDPVAALTREVVAWADRDPSAALARAERTVAIADALPRDRYSPVEIARARAGARRYRALPLRYLARYKDVLSALDEALDILQPFDALFLERSLVQFSRGTTLQETGRYEEARAVLAECRTVFEAHADARTLLFLGMAEVALLWRTSKLEAAREAWLSLVPAAREAGDVQTLASIHNNLAYTLIDLGSFSDAEEHLNEAVQLFGQIDRPLLALRSELARGRLWIKRGSIDEGVSHLQSVRERFLEQSLVEEAGLCGLEIVEGELARGRPAEAETLARDIVREFTAAQLNTRAITALRFLSEAIAARKASAATAENVLQFIRGLRADPGAKFRASA